MKNSFNQNCDHQRSTIQHTEQHSSLATHSENNVRRRWHNENIFFLVHLTRKSRQAQSTYIVSTSCAPYLHHSLCKNGEISQIGKWNAMDTGMAHAQHLKCFCCVGNSITFELATSAASSSLHTTTYILHRTSHTAQSRTTFFLATSNWSLWKEMLIITY